MKMLISDYDYTIKPFENNPNIIKKNIFKKNLEAINRFIEKGNIFVIATGRSPKSIKKDINEYKINYNYLITYNGRVIFDKDGNIIYANYLDKDIVNNLLNEEFITEYSKFDEYELNNETKNVVYLRLQLKNTTDLEIKIYKLRYYYPNIKITYDTLLKILNIRNYFNKSMSIEKLIEIENIDINKEDIYTVGDDINDYEMIKDYNGYKMLFSNPELITASSKTTTSINRLIKKLEKNI